MHTIMWNIFHEENCKISSGNLYSLYQLLLATSLYDMDGCLVIVESLESVKPK